MPAAPRAELAQIAAVPHGARPLTELRALGLPEGPALDFSASLSPLGPPAAVAEALANLDPSRYPDPTAAPLREALAAQLQIPPDQILCGNGSSELIGLAAQAYLKPGDGAFILGPTYGEYTRACQIAGAEPRPFIARKRDQFLIDVNILARILERDRPQALFLCNPNNPTGLLLTRAQIQSVADAFPGLLVVDEAYMPFVAQPESLLDLATDGRLLLIRSLTKSYALAGLRLGYAVGSREAVQALRKLQPPWSVNSAAIAAGLAALEDTDYLPRAVAAVDEAKAYLKTELAELGFQVAASAANFLLISVGDAPGMARKLLERGIVVRDCSSFNLPEFIRVGIRKLSDCQALISTLRTLVPPSEPWRDPIL